MTATSLLFAAWAESPAFLAVALIAIALAAFLFFLILFEPGLEYRLTAPTAALGSEDYLKLLGALTDAQVHCCNRAEVLTNGQSFYEAELKAIREARRSVNLEFYIFETGTVANRFLEALTERARAGVAVKVVLDAIGSKSAGKGDFRELRAAGGQIAWYHPVRWYNFKRLNNRTHRDLLIVDGRVGFLGGAGVADHWLLGRSGEPPWRDTMVRVEGDAAASLQSAFVENWLEAAEEVITGEDCFPPHPPEEASGVAGLVINSSPSAGRATRARILYQILLASARREIQITSPYFLPDRSARRELVRAARERGVSVKILTAGSRCDHLLARRASRRIYGELLQAGVEIYEYQPAMMHAKVMVIDGLWSVVGSTNFDPRSFGHNDEVNLAARDATLAGRLGEDFVRDLAGSYAVSLGEWQQRPLWERPQEWIAWVLERQA